MSQSEKITKLHNKFKKHFLWVEKRKFSRFEAWLDLFTEASPGGTTKRISDGREFHMQAGLVAIGINSTVRNWQWDTTELSEFIKLLEKEKMIKLVLPLIPRPIEDPLIVLKIINYKKYQGVGDPNMTETGEEVVELSYPDLRNIVLCWSENWHKRYNRKPVVKWAADINLARTLLKQLTKPEIFSAIERYFEDDGDFITKDRHSFSLFVRQVNRYIETTGNDGLGIGRLA